MGTLVQLANLFSRLPELERLPALRLLPLQLGPGFLQDHLARCERRLGGLPSAVLRRDGGLACPHGSRRRRRGAPMFGLVAAGIRVYRGPTLTLSRPRPHDSSARQNGHLPV